MAHTITIEALAEGLNQVSQQFSTIIHDTLRTGLEFETQVPMVETDYAYTGQKVSLGQVLQPYQYQFTPVNSETFDGITSYLKPIKSDLLFSADQLEDFFSKWRPSWFTPDPNKTQMGYAQYVIQNHILPKITEDLNTLSWSGEYAAPTPGTAGALAGSVDGFKVNLETHISDGLISPLAVGAIVPSSMVDQVREFCQLIPEPYRYRKGIIFMSKTNAQYYADNYQDKWKTRLVNEQQQDSLYLRVDHYNKMIVGVTAMEGSDRFICNFDNLASMIVGSRRGYPPYFNFRFEPEDRTLKCFAEIYRFYNLETALHIFLNDQE